jgi:segregation and condensation protein B
MQDLNHSQLSAEDVEESIAENVSEGTDDVFIAEAVSNPTPEGDPQARIKAIIEAAIYITDEPLSAEQIATAIEEPLDLVMEILDRLVADYGAPDRGLSVREIAGGYKMATKPEHHEAVRRFVKNLQPPLKLSLAALETLAVIAYKQPVTAPEIMEIRGVQGASVLSTLLARKLIAHAGRKNVLGKPILYKTTREFLVQFGLNSLSELPTLKEFEDLGRLALTDSDEFSRSGEAESETAAAPQPEAPAPDA